MGKANESYKNSALDNAQVDLNREGDKLTLKLIGFHMQLSEQIN